MERWPFGAGTTSALAAPSPVVQMLFITEGRAQISGDGFEPFAVERNQIAVVPSLCPRWSLVGDEVTEVIRILPVAD
jgi:hypothetical protein